MPWTVTREELDRFMDKAMGLDPDKQGFFRDHRCWKCQDGEKPSACRFNHPRACEFPHARND